MKTILGVSSDAELLLETWECFVLGVEPAPADSASWRAFLDSLESRGLPIQQRSAFRDLWTHVRNAIGARVTLPAVDTTDEGQLVMRWSTPGFYAEAEVSPDGKYEWFFRDRLLDRHSGSDEPQAAIPGDFIRILATAFRS